MQDNKNSVVDHAKRFAGAGKTIHVGGIEQCIDGTRRGGYLFEACEAFRHSSRTQVICRVNFGEQETATEYARHKLIL